MKSILITAAFALLAVSIAGSARADDAPAEELQPAPAPKPKTEHVRLRVGARVTFVSDAGLDPFAEHDALPQLSLEGDYLLWQRGHLGLSVGAAYDVGGSGASTRTTDTKLQVHRLTAPIEGRWAFAPWLYSFARIAPGAAALAVTSSDPSSPEDLEGTKWVFATDLSAGAAVRVFQHVWVTPEIGYAWTAKGDLHADPGRDEGDVLGRDERTGLGSLALAGGFFRVSAAVSF